MNTEPEQQPISNERADDPDQEVANDPETGSSNEMTRQPAGNQAHHEDDQQAFIGHVHRSPLEFAETHGNALCIRTVPKLQRPKTK